MRMAVSSGVRNQEPLIEGSAKMAFGTGLSGASVSREAEWVKPGLWSLPVRSGPTSTTLELGPWTNPSAPLCCPLGCSMGMMSPSRRGTLRQ